MNLKSRLEKLELEQNHDDIAVMIYRWSGEGQFAYVKAPAGQNISRLPEEDNESFLERAVSELRVLTKNETRVGPLVLWVLRESETPTESEPQFRPQLTKEEWLVAHGLSITGRG